MSTETIAHSPKQSQKGLSSISVMLDYDIDNTLNSIKENSHLINKMASCYSPDSNNHDIEKNSNNTKDELTEHPKTNAQKRWKILAKVLRKNSEDYLQEDEDQMASVRRFKTFDLFQQDTFAENIERNVLGKRENWYTYKISLVQNEFSANIYHMDQHLTAADLMGFNNTGNICVWPSEEALTVYALSDILRFNNKWVLELGGGMTCLTGIMIAKYGKPYAVHLTDGNSMSVENVRRTICLNELSCYTKCSVLKWENSAIRLCSEIEKFDYILSADCLFFDDARSDLVDTIWFFLARNGTALIMAPQRGKTLSSFIKECMRKGFGYQIIHRYNDIIWRRHIELQTSDFYNEDIHYPILVKLFKPNSSANLVH